VVQYTVHPLTKLSHPSKYNLSHIIFANDLCQHHSFTPSFTHIFVNNKSLTHHLSHILLHIIFATIFVPPSFTRQSFTHTFVNINLSHTIFYTYHLSDHLSHTILGHPPPLCAARVALMAGGARGPVSVAGVVLLDLGLKKSDGFASF